mmetsp:Transcript_6934/g.13810  ORF Transcript_6934/g.13810 Transcript_6934/m.13810 type:complete len:271 (-) Transcript_6934:147-959(-)
MTATLSLVLRRVAISTSLDAASAGLRPFLKSFLTKSHPSLLDTTSHSPSDATITNSSVSDDTLISKTSGTDMTGSLTKVTESANSLDQNPSRMPSANKFLSPSPLKLASPKARDTAKTPHTLPSSTHPPDSSTRCDSAATTSPVPYTLCSVLRSIGPFVRDMTALLSPTFATMIRSLFTRTVVAVHPLPRSGSGCCVSHDKSFSSAFLYESVNTDVNSKGQHNPSSISSGRHTAPTEYSVKTLLTESNKCSSKYAADAIPACPSSTVANI